MIKKGASSVFYSVEICLDTWGSSDVMQFTTSQFRWALWDESSGELVVDHSGH